MKFLEGLEQLARDGRVSTQTGRYLRNGLGLFTATVDLAAMVSGDQALRDVTVNGIRTTDILLGYDFRPTAVDVGFDMNITADNTVRIICHHDAATVTDPTSATLTILVARPQFLAGLKRLVKEVDVSRQTAQNVAQGFKIYSQAVDVPAMTSGLQTLLDVTVNGLTTDEIAVGFDFRPASSTDVAYSIRTTAANTLQITCHHDAATVTNPTSATLILWTLRP